MKCARCNRPILNKPTATVQTRLGAQAWGPVCARKAGLLPEPARRFPLRRLSHRPQAEQGDEQLALEFA